MFSPPPKPLIFPFITVCPPSLSFADLFLVLFVLGSFLETFSPLLFNPWVFTGPSPPLLSNSSITPQHESPYRAVGLLLAIVCPPITGHPVFVAQLLVFFVGIPSLILQIPILSALFVHFTLTLPRIPIPPEEGTPPFLRLSWNCFRWSPTTGIFSPGPSYTPRDGFLVPSPSPPSLCFIDPCAPPPTFYWASATVLAQHPTFSNPLRSQKGDYLLFSLFFSSFTSPVSWSDRSSFLDPCPFGCMIM